MKNEQIVCEECKENWAKLKVTTYAMNNIIVLEDSAYFGEEEPNCELKFTYICFFCCEENHWVKDRVHCDETDEPINDVISSKQIALEREAAHIKAKSICVFD